MIPFSYRVDSADAKAHLASGSRHSMSECGSTDSSRLMEKTKVGIGEFHRGSDRHGSARASRFIQLTGCFMAGAYFHRSKDDDEMLQVKSLLKGEKMFYHDSFGPMPFKGHARRVKDARDSWAVQGHRRTRASALPSAIISSRCDYVHLVECEPTVQ